MACDQTRHTLFEANERVSVATINPIHATRSYPL